MTPPDQSLLFRLLLLRLLPLLRLLLLLRLLPLLLLLPPRLLPRFVLGIALLLYLMISLSNRLND